MTWRLTLTPEADDKDRFRRVGAALSPKAADHTSYRATEEIVEAVNTAVALGRPLLVAGEPGTGKTRLAYWIAWRFGLMRADRPDKPEVLRADVKSTTTGSDLLYRYDAIGHFRAATIRQGQEPGESGSPVSARKFIELEALGRGIALSCSLDELPGNPEMQDLVRGSLDEDHTPRISVVLIDEIDKAPRDVPNDLLREFDEMVVRIPELGPDAILSPLSGLRPLVIVTTNQESALPDAFLRRCCFLHIEYPKPEQLREIVEATLDTGWASASLVSDVIQLTELLRVGEGTTLAKRPGTSEIIDYLLILRDEGAQPDGRLLDADASGSLARQVFATSDTDKAKIADALTKLSDGDG